MLLELEGYACVTAHNGVNGIAAASRHPPALALVDIRLPDMDGCTLAQRLREAHGASLRLIALTGMDDTATRARIDAAGFDGCMIKPFQPANLLALLRRVAEPPALA